LNALRTCFSLKDLVFSIVIQSFGIIGINLLSLIKSMWLSLVVISLLKL